MSHSGNEFVFCLRGELIYEVGEETFVMEAGDALLFSASLEHKWRNPGNTVTNALIMICGFRAGESPAKYHLASGKTENFLEEEEEKEK